MTEEEHEELQDSVSENEEVLPQEEHQEREEQKMVPLSALQAERRKRQEYETRNKVYESMLAERQKNQLEENQEDDDPDALVTKSSFIQEKALTKREILEQVYQDVNPEVVQKINTYLKPILNKKPWLAETLDNSPNRLARANEIIDDYMHLFNEKPKTKINDAKKVVENSQKPRSPVEIGKNPMLSRHDYLKKIQGTKEFRDYREKVRRGEI